MAAGVIVCCGIGLALFFRYGWLLARVLFVLGGKPTVAWEPSPPCVRPKSSGERLNARVF